MIAPFGEGRGNTFVNKIGTERKNDGKHEMDLYPFSQSLLDVCKEGHSKLNLPGSWHSTGEYWSLFATPSSPRRPNETRPQTNRRPADVRAIVWVPPAAT